MQRLTLDARVQAFSLETEADYDQIMVNSGADPAITEGVKDPYMQPHHLKVPEKVYTQDPPYDRYSTLHSTETENWNPNPNPEIQNQKTEP